MTVFRRLEQEIHEFERELGKELFDNRLSQVRPKVYAHKDGRRGAGYLSELDLDEEFFWNFVLLEEVIKELVAILLNHSVGEFSYLSYVS